jgi:ubiquinone/menaquinone biosynthesis C-methylase UbiE
LSLDQYGNWQKYQSKNPLQQALITRFLAEVRSLVASLPIRSIADVGCGEGFVLDMLLAPRPNLTVVGADLDHEALCRGRTLFPNIPFVRADIRQLPYPAHSFDLVVCTEVLEHLPDPQVALQEMCRVSGRYCLFSVPHEPLFRLSNFIRGKSITRLGNDIDHLQNWSQAGFTRLLNPYLNLLHIKRSFPWLVVLGEAR